jgi:hypothetical protein
MARGVRAGLVGTLIDTRKTKEFLERWKVGELLKSGEIREKENNQILNQNKDD